jgi:site-specific recombinase XerD
MGNSRAPTWPDTLEGFRLYLVALGRARGTVKSYWQDIRAFGRWCEPQGFTPVEAPETAVLAYIGRSYEGLALSTVQHRILSFRAFYRWLIAFGRRRGDPTRTLKLRPIHRQPGRPYTDEELRALLAACENDPPRALRDRTILLLFIGGGLRLSELTGIKTQDIDWEAGRILVHGKGAKERWIAPGKAAMASLAQYLGRDRETVFTIGPAAVELVIARRAEEAGLSGVHPHGFRRTFAVRFSEISGDIGALASCLGHEDIKMSLHYAGFTQKARALDVQARLGLADRLLEPVGG